MTGQQHPPGQPHPGSHATITRTPLILTSWPTATHQRPLAEVLGEMRRMNARA